MIEAATQIRKSAISRAFMHSSHLFCRAGDRENPLAPTRAYCSKSCGSVELPRLCKPPGRPGRRQLPCIHTHKPIIRRSCDVVKNYLTGASQEFIY